MTDDELMKRAEEYMEQLMALRQGEPILCQKPVPPIDQLESWRKDAIRLGFDPEDVRLVFVTPAAGSLQRGTRSASNGNRLGSSCMGNWWMRQVAAGALAKPAAGVTDDSPTGTQANDEVVNGSGPQANESNRQNETRKNSCRWSINENE